MAAYKYTNFTPQIHPDGLDIDIRERADENWQIFIKQFNKKGE